VSRILIVDDEPQILRALRINLTARKYDVVTAADGTEALHQAKASRPDLIFLDLGLPDMDGVDVIRRLRTWTPVPIVVLSGRSTSNDKVDALDAGADDYVTKPFEIEELRARVRALIRRGPGERPPVLAVGDLLLDPAARTVSRGGAPISLATKEFTILEYFMRHPGQVLSRARILEHVWDFAHDGDSNIVDVYVRILREKIDRPFGARSIETVRGVGYRLTP
jgi:DNA-binding response OmpR family regulator